MQPHKIQQAQHMQEHANLHNLFHQMGGYRNFKSSHQQNELDLVMQSYPQEHWIEDSKKIGLEM